MQVEGTSTLYGHAHPYQRIDHKIAGERVPSMRVICISSECGAIIQGKVVQRIIGSMYIDKALPNRA